MKHIQNMTTNHESIMLGKGDNMSPKLRAAQYTAIIPERVKQVAQQRNVKMKDLASAVGTVYENFSRQVRKGTIQKDWLEIMCDRLDVSRDFLTGARDNPGCRIDDYDQAEKKKEYLGMFLKYSAMGHYVKKISALTGNDLYAIEEIIIALLDSPEEFYELIPLNKLEEIHFREVSKWK